MLGFALAFPFGLALEFAGPSIFAPLPFALPPALPFIAGVRVPTAEFCP
jgi:hypothetical protein